VLVEFALSASFDLKIFMLRSVARIAVGVSAIPGRDVRPAGDTKGINLFKRLNPIGR